MELRHIGRQGQLYVGKHTVYGDTPTPAASDALRHVQFLMSHDPTNRRNSPEKKQSPGHAVRFTGREIATLRQLTCLIRPSGTLNTVPEADDVYEAALGGKSNVTLATTVNAGTGTVNGATLASTTGLVAGRSFVLITCPDGRKRARRILTLPGSNVVTWRPLPAGQAPADGAAVKAGITYYVTTANAIALWFAHYLLKTDQTAGFKRLAPGITFDRFAFNFLENEEPQFTASGMGQTVLTAGSVPAKPGAFTEVGGNPPSGVSTAELYIGTTLMDFLKLGIDITTGQALRNDEYGFSQARDVYKRDRMEFGFSLEAMAENQTVLYDLAAAGSNPGLMLQDGFTEGNIIAIDMPKLEPKVPDTDDPDTEVKWPFRGVALESADGANDQLFFGLL